MRWDLLIIPNSDYKQFCWWYEFEGRLDHQTKEIEEDVKFLKIFLCKSVKEKGGGD